MRRAVRGIVMLYAYVNSLHLFLVFPLPKVVVKLSNPPNYPAIRPRPCESQNLQAYLSIIYIYIYIYIFIYLFIYLYFYLYVIYLFIFIYLVHKPSKPQPPRPFDPEPSLPQLACFSRGRQELEAQQMQQRIFLRQARGKL